MNKRNRITFLAIATIIAVACACPMTSLPGSGDPTEVSNIPLPTVEIPTLPPVDVPSGNVVLQDDFSSDTGEWETFPLDDEGSAQITNGVYELVSIANLWIWGRTDTEFSNTVVDFDAVITQAPSNDNAGVGIYCRVALQDDTSLDAYMLAISADGYYAILDFEGGSPTPLVDWAFSDAINQGNSSNHIRATCDGDQLTLEVNGQELGSATIPAGGRTSGALAFATVSFEDAEQTSRAEIDNVFVVQP